MHVASKLTHQAIGWSLTGATNSSQPNLSLLYQMPAAHDDTAAGKPSCASQYSHSYPSFSVGSHSEQNSFAHNVEARAGDAAQSATLPTRPGKYSPHGGNVTASDANLLLGLNPSYSPSRTPSTYSQPTPPQLGNQSSYTYSMPSVTADQQPDRSHMAPRTNTVQSGIGSQAGDMFIESQDIDMGSLHHQNNLPFALNGEIVPWLEYLPQDVLNYFGDGQDYLIPSTDGTSRPPQ